MTNITLPEEELERLTLTATRFVLEASRDIVWPAHQKRNFTVEAKSDGSKVTTADLASHRFLVKSFRAMTPSIPVISEEFGEHQPEIPEDATYWTLDPIDGTDKFIAGNKSGFFINAALIENKQPVIGIIHNPWHKETFLTWKGAPVFIDKGNMLQPVPITESQRPKDDFRVVKYDDPKKNKMNEEAEKLFLSKDFNLASFPKEDITYKLRGMRIALNEIDFALNAGREDSYQNCVGYSWDYAGDVLFAKNAGGIVIDLSTGKELEFSHPAERMNAMAFYRDRNLGKRHFNLG